MEELEIIGVLNMIEQVHRHILASNRLYKTISTQVNDTLIIIYTWVYNIIVQIPDNDVKN